MLSFEEFKTAVRAEIYRLLSENYEDFKGWDVIDSTRFSINRKIEFMELRPPERKSNGNTVLPSFRYMPMYDSYISGFPVVSIAENIADALIENLETPLYSSDQPLYTDKVLDTDNIYIALINRDLNREFLKTVPHFRFLDLAVIFRALLPFEADGEYSTVITDAMLKDLDMSREELLSIACSNSMQDYPPVAEYENRSYKITASSGFICSHALVCDKLLYDIACKEDCNLYIAPITLKFSIAFPENTFKQNVLEESSRRIYSRLRDEDKLSDSIYYYDRHSNILSICSSGRSGEADLQKPFGA